MVFVLSVIKVFMGRVMFVRFWIVFIIFSVLFVVFVGEFCVVRFFIVLMVLCIVRKIICF